MTESECALRCSSAVVHEQAGELQIETVALQTLAERFDTPLFVYSHQAIEVAYRTFEQALQGVSHRICYAVKANGSLALLRILAHMGAGFDIVSRGELERVLAVGGNAGRVTFSGVGKRLDELEYALDAGVGCFNIESGEELLRLNAVGARLGKMAPISIRVNPDIEGHTHPHLTTGRHDDKFGVPIEQARALYRQARSLPAVRIIGVACHIGSSLQDPAPFVAAGEHLIAFADRLAKDGFALEHLDFGGGFPIAYRDDESLPSLGEFLNPLKQAASERGLQVLVEPGRSIMGPAGVLLTRVEYTKPGDGVTWIVVDAGMTELIRPPLYDAWHTIRAVKRRGDRSVERCHVVGPVCESADFLGRDRMLGVMPGDVLAVMDTGAYGAVMASNYNARPRPAEVLVNGDKAALIRRRETFTDLVRLEVLPEDSFSKGQAQLV